MKKAIILSMLLAASLAHGQMFAQTFGTTEWTPAALNPVAWWSFETTNGSVNVDSISGKAMTLVGSPAVDTGIRGNCITISSGKYGSWVEFSSATNFSYSLWIKTGSPASDMMVFGNASSLAKIVEKPNATALSLKFGGASLISFSTPSFGTGWRMFTFSCSGNVSRVYIDGVESSTGARSVDGANINIFNQIGRFGSRSDFFWNGQIDEFTVYNYTLSQAQITQLYEYK